MAHLGKINFFERLFKGKYYDPESDIVEEGDAFFQVGMGSTSWVVERICADIVSGIKHVVITRKGIWSGSKIISTITLLNNNLYRRDRRDEDKNNTFVKKRRNPDRYGRH